jgi:hypothetical protein
MDNIIHLVGKMLLAIFFVDSLFVNDVMNDCVDMIRECQYSHYYFPGSAMQINYAVTLCICLLISSKPDFVDWLSWNPAPATS